MSARLRCVACGQTFRALANVPEQSYCSEAACQRERRKLWQRTRRAEDPDYRDNQARAQAAWLDRNPDYWRHYREQHPEYTERNRERQRERNKDARGTGPASHSVSDAHAVLASGLYRVTVIAVEGIAKKNASFLVELVRVNKSTR